MAFPDPTTNSLVDCWSMDASSGNETGLENSNVLVDNNTVGTAAGIISTSRDFVLANSEYFDIADATATTAGLAGSDRDFSITCWVYFTALNAGHQGVVSKFKNGVSGYVLYNPSTSTNLRFLARGSGSQALPTIGISAATWYFVHCYHDSVNNEVGMSLNAGSYTTNGLPLGVGDGAENDFYVGNGSVGAWPHDGRLDQVCFWDSTLLSGSQISDLYNGGSGVAYSAGGAAGTPLHHYRRNRMLKQNGIWVPDRRIAA